MVNNKIIFVSDAWHPQVNGVVVVLTSLIDALNRLGVVTEVVHPGLFVKVPLPFYSEIKCAINPWKISRHLDSNDFAWVHAVTEGPLGIAARSYCKRNSLAFSTAVHTKFPEYSQILAGTPKSWGENYIRWFHQSSNLTIVQSESQLQELQAIGLKKLFVVGGGVDTDRFQPHPRPNRTRPRLLFVGRVSKEKSVEDFLLLDIDAEKVVVGDGPDRVRLQEKYPSAQFLGYKIGDDLVNEYAQADCLVFPSRTDTFGLVLVEAMACGTPVAAYPVTGPIDVVRGGVSGFIGQDLLATVEKSLKLDRDSVRNEALSFSWENVAKRFAEIHGIRTAENLN